MAHTAEQPALLEVAPSAGIDINSRCQIYDEDGLRVVMVAGLPIYRYHADDRAAEGLFVAQLLDAGLAKPGELAAALHRGVATMHRYRARYREQGAAGLVSKKSGPKGPRLGAAREAAIRRWNAQGGGAREMARRLGVSPATVLSALKRMGLAAGQTDQHRQLVLGYEAPVVACPAEGKWQAADGSDDSGDQALPETQNNEPRPETEGNEVLAANATESDEPRPETEGDDPLAANATESDEPRPETEGDEPLLAANATESREARPATGSDGPQPAVAMSLDVDPADRSIDRLLAARGELLDAAPLFASALSVPRAGVLLGVPLLVASGVLEASEEIWGHIGPAFYGLRTTLVTLVFLALLRIKHSENVKEYSPPELGRVLGLDRAPEVKTIRRKLARLAADSKVERFLEQMVKRRVASRSEALGFLYVDGHVRVYSGKTNLPKTHVARMRLSLPATQDIWVNDADGAPLFFVTQEAHPSLVQALSSLLPDVRRLVGDRRVTVVFDRGGWSPKLFKKMDDAGFDVLTYRKGKTEQVAIEAFKTYEVPGTNGKLTYELHDAEISLLKGTFTMRQVTRRKGEHQTQIVTTRRDLDVVEVARRMFDRWRQENFFKYMRENYTIDALVEYGDEPADTSRLVPNPARREQDKKLRAAREELNRLEAAYGAAAIDNPEEKRPTMRGFKIANGTQIGIPLRDARKRVAELEKKRSGMPVRVPVGDVLSEVMRLPVQRKRLSDALKMLAYQIETDMQRAVAPFYARSLREGRRLVCAALQSAVDIEVSQDELKVTLAPQSSPHRSRAIAQLCEILNATNTRFPGSSLRLRYVVKQGYSITEQRG